MPRIKTLVCSGICFLNVTAITAQVLPKNSSMQQIVGYHLYQQKKWSMQQLPKNSVLYQYNSNLPGQSSRLLLVNIPSFKYPIVPEVSFSEKIRSNLQRIPRQSYIVWPGRPCMGTLIKRRLVLGSEFVEKGPVFFYSGAHIF